MDREDCQEPDPADHIDILAWLKKRGSVVDLTKFDRKWSNELIDGRSFTKTYADDLILIALSRGGKKVVWLKDKVWADQWLRFYEKEVPHHGQPQRNQNKFSVTENNK